MEADQLERLVEALANVLTIVISSLVLRDRYRHWKTLRASRSHGNEKG